MWSSGEIGIHARLKIWCSQGHVGSSPTWTTILQFKKIEKSIFCNRGYLVQKFFMLHLKKWIRIIINIFANGILSVR